MELAAATVNDFAIIPALIAALLAIVCLIVYIVGARGGAVRSLLGAAFAGILLAAIPFMIVPIGRRLFGEYPGYEWVAWTFYLLADAIYLTMLVTIIIEQHRGRAAVPPIVPERTRTMSNTNVTLDPETGEPTATPTPKVVAATTGAALGGAVSTVAVYAFETLANVDLPPLVEGALLVIITAVCAFGAGYIKRP